MSVGSALQCDPACICAASQERGPVFKVKVSSVLPSLGVRSETPHSPPKEDLNLWIKPFYVMGVSIDLIQEPPDGNRKSVPIEYNL